MYKMKQEISLEQFSGAFNGRLTQGSRKLWKGFDQRRDMITSMWNGEERLETGRPREAGPHLLERL